MCFGETSSQIQFHDTKEWQRREILYQVAFRRSDEFKSELNVSYSESINYREFFIIIAFNFTDSLGFGRM